MAWDGARIKALAKARKISLTHLAASMQTSRQTVNDWIKGQTPKGTHLINLSKFFSIQPTYFFTEDETQPISFPLHRTRGVAKRNAAMEEDTLTLAREYENLFRFAPSPGLISVLRGRGDDETAQRLALKFRSLVGLETDKPMDYEHAFKLLEKLNIVCIFREFVSNIKSYAFYCRIHKHRVIFINTKTNVLDLVFPLLHEVMHAVRAEEGLPSYDEEEERFCDMAAGSAQFPESYVDFVYDSIKGLAKPQQINTLKRYSVTHGHSLYGIYKQIENKYGKIDLNIHGANTTLKKESLSVGEILLQSKDPKDYIARLRIWSPLFFEIVSRQVDNPSTRKFGEWLGLDNSIDAEQARKEWKQIIDCN